MIRNLIYLDSEKLRSLSSQLFEGITEYVLRTESKETDKKENQKGPLGSGRVLADIFSRGESSTELTFLEDHAYSIFEGRLIKDDLVELVYDGQEGPVAGLDKSFVRVTGKMTLNDVGAITNFVASFNEFGEALYRVIHRDAIAVGNKGKPLSDHEVRTLARQLDMQLEPKFAQALKTTMSHAFQDLVEAQVAAGDLLFSAPLKRGSLREPERMLIDKFSRRSQCDFTLLGIVTQRGVAPVSPALKQLTDASNLKEAIRFMIDHMNELENAFTAPTNNEVILDPIAIYMSV